MVEQNRSSLELRAQGGLVGDLRRGRITDESEATARAHALGLRPALTYVPMAARLRETSGADAVLVQQRRVRTRDAMMRHPLRGSHRFEPGPRRRADRRDPAPQRTSGSSSESDLEPLCATIRREVTRVEGVLDCVIGVGPESSRLVDAASGLSQAGHVAEVAMSMGGRTSRTTGPPICVCEASFRSFDRPSRSGVRRDRARGSAGSSRQARRRGLRPSPDLPPAGRKQDRAPGHYCMSRPTLYARLDALKRMVGVDLDDAESRTSLHGH